MAVKQQSNNQGKTMSSLNKEQLWICEQIGDEWHGAITFAITRGPLDQLIPVYPRKCTQEYCVSHKQWYEWKADHKTNQSVRKITDEMFSPLFDHFIKQLDSLPSIDAEKWGGGPVERNELFAKAPLDATHINKYGRYWTINGNYDSEVNPDGVVEIPERERELNRWVDNFETFGDAAMGNDRSGFKFTSIEFWDRKDIRHPESNDPLNMPSLARAFLGTGKSNDSELPYSSVDEIPEKLKWLVNSEDTYKADNHFIFKRGNRHCYHCGDKIEGWEMYDQRQFECAKDLIESNTPEKPDSSSESVIQTPEQKAEIERNKFVQSYLESFGDTRGEMKHGAHDFYDWLIETGRLTKGDK